VLGTASAAQLDFDHPVPPIDALPPDSVQANDVHRFQHFADGWMVAHPDNPHVIVDLRYATRPDRINPLWGIEMDPAHPDRHVKLAFFSDLGNRWSAHWNMVFGRE